MKKWIPVFKTGMHTDSEGRTRSWNEGDLDHIVSSYDPANHEAPVVIGHPKSNAPAWAWVEGLKRVGSILLYREKNAQPEFEDMRKRGLFKKRSISLNADGSLRHIGWLGATPPAVKGLPDVAFGDQGGLTIEFEDSADTGAGKDRKEDHMSFWERLKKRLADAGISFAEIFGSETPPTLYTEADMQTKVETAVKVALEGKEAAFSEARKKQDDELRKREDALRKKESEAAKKGIADFIEDLKKKGILVPAMEKLGMGVTTFMEQLAVIETPIEFGEGDEKSKQTPLEFMQAFLSALPKSIEFGEAAGDGKDPGKGGDAEKREKLISDFMEKNKDSSYRDAVLAVSNEHPDLFRER